MQWSNIKKLFSNPLIELCPVLKLVLTGLVLNKREHELLFASFSIKLVRKKERERERKKGRKKEKEEMGEREGEGERVKNGEKNERKRERGRREREMYANPSNP